MHPRLRFYCMVTSLGGSSISGDETIDTQADYFPVRWKSVRESFFSAHITPAPPPFFCLKTILSAILEKNKTGFTGKLHPSICIPRIKLFCSFDQYKIKQPSLWDWFHKGKVFPIQNLLQDQYVQTPQLRLAWCALGLCSYQPTYRKMHFTVLHIGVCSSLLPCTLP